MTNNALPGTPGAIDPCHVFLTAKEVILRYGWGRAYGYQMLRSTGFPRRIGDRFRLDTLIAW
jgi:predicted DNA-binding transcriptional regulator AlpA